jgi:hypothetical protein
METDMTIDRLLAQKWKILDRLNTMSDIADRYTKDCAEDYDEQMFERIQMRIRDEINSLISEIKKREGRT